MRAAAKQSLTIGKSMRLLRRFAPRNDGKIRMLIRNRSTRDKHPATSIKKQASNIKHPVTSNQHPETRNEHPESSNKYQDTKTILQINSAARSPARSPINPAGIACLVFLIPTAPK